MLTQSETEEFNKLWNEEEIYSSEILEWIKLKKEAWLKEGEQITIERAKERAKQGVSKSKNN